MVGTFRLGDHPEDVESVPLISSGESASSREASIYPGRNDDRNDHQDQADRRIGSFSPNSSRGLRPWSTFVGGLPWARTRSRTSPNGRGIFASPRNGLVSSEQKYTSLRPSCSWLFHTLVLIAFLTSTLNLFLSATRLASPTSPAFFRTATIVSNPGRGFTIPTRQEIEGLRSPSSYVGLDRVPEIKHRLALAAGNTSTGASSHSN